VLRRERSRALRRTSRDPGSKLGLGSRERRDAEFAALLHDVGKVRIPNAIITKPGPLTTEERAIIERHTIEGERLLLRVGGLLGEIGHIVRSCHERYDGKGYPDGLAGEKIPLLVRIVACCDARPHPRPRRSRSSASRARNAVRPARRRRADRDSRL
jgi:HD-GYP domain-containing protein (c-di-GMP phosphodiesterase class II)